jgi:hypothetical protein
MNEIITFLKNNKIINDNNFHNLQRFGAVLLVETGPNGQVYIIQAFSGGRIKLFLYPDGTHEFILI